MAPVTAFEEEAFQVDAYLDDLLAVRFGALPPLGSGDPVDPDLEAAADLARRSLVRFHPSFRFEERLAARLRREAEASGDVGAVTRAEDSTQPTAMIVLRRAMTESAPGGVDRRNRNGLLLGGAIASGVSLAGVSICGAALIAWRRTRAEARWDRTL